MAIEAVEGGGAGRDLAQVFCRVESAFGVFVVLVEADAVDVGGAADGRDGEDVIPASGLRGRSLFESGDGDGAVLGGAVVGQGAFGDAAGDRVQVVVAGFAANFWEFSGGGLPCCLLMASRPALARALRCTPRRAPSQMTPSMPGGETRGTASSTKAEPAETDSAPISILVVR